MMQLGVTDFTQLSNRQRIEQVLGAEGERFHLCQEERATIHIGLSSSPA